MAGQGVPIPSVLTIDDFMSGTVNLVAGIYTRMGSYTVKKGEQVAFGSGLYDALNEATGRFYAELNDSTPVAINGRMRVTVVDYNDNLIFHVGEFDMEELRQGKTVRAERYPFPLQKLAAAYGRKIVIDFLCSTSETVSNTDSVMWMSATRKYVSND